MKAFEPMDVTPAGMVTEVRLVQDWKAAEPMAVIRSEMGASSREEHEVNKPSGIVWMVSGSTMDCSFLQPWKSEVPRLVRLSGRVTDSKAAQPRKTLFPREETLLGRIRERRDAQL